MELYLDKFDPIFRLIRIGCFIKTGKVYSCNHCREWDFALVVVVACQRNSFTLLSIP